MFEFFVPKKANKNSLIHNFAVISAKSEEISFFEFFEHLSEAV